MKNTILLFFILFACACSETEVKSLTLYEKIDLKIKSELEKGIINDTIILNHQFGMDRKAVNKHKNRLLKAKRIYGIYKTKNTRVFVYDLETRKFEKLTFYFDTFYNDDEELYRMECKPKIEDDKDIAAIQRDVIDLFKGKYGKPDFLVPNDTLTDYKTALWIKNNQKIEIGRDEEEVILAYTDLIRSQKLVKDF